MTIVASFAPGPEGEAALKAAVDLSKREGAPLVVVGTVPTMDEHEGAQKILAESPASVVNVREGDDAVEVILDTVNSHDASLLVIGLRRRSPVGKLVLGSSAQRLLLDAPCPVVCVKPGDSVSS